ncbi:MAG: hypothetical protein Q8M15_15290 [Bacteroidota bacterium]|nr:hypothetical protein [Bacteroidota bacterium]
MKNIYSFIIYCIICLIALNYRISYPENKSEQAFKVTTWDALGYYVYLPGIFIYHDYTQFAWLPAIDSTYAVSGGTIYQVNKIENGNYVTKYLGGIAILEMPFFLIGHIIAINSHYAADGFSPPYQYSISFGILIYFLLGLFILRNILLRYYSDLTTSITLLLIALATNAIQYAAIDSAQSHIPIFFLYALVIYSTIKWHQKPTIFFASLTGFIIGLATISRPTEAIMFLIPLLWNTQTKEQAREKWALLKNNRLHLWCIILFGIIGILPQLIYWKIASGHFIYDVGSKWTFLNPFFRVLFGFEKGWFIYTPVTIFFIMGLFFVKKYPFKKSVIYFCILNIWIIISWFDWRYGGSYSTRALVQSYPVFALALGAFIDYVSSKKWRYIFYLTGIYLIYVNLFQIWQYNHAILHYNGMNRLYYSKVYLNPNPAPLVISLLENPEWLDDESEFKQEVIFKMDTALNLNFNNDSMVIIADLNPGIHNPEPDVSTKWLKIESSVKIINGESARLYSELIQEDSIKRNSINLFNPRMKSAAVNDYAFYVNIPEYYKQSRIKLFLTSTNRFECIVEKTKITLYQNGADEFK